MLYAQPGAGSAHRLAAGEKTGRLLRKEENRMETVGRFAPSPSGRMHLGNLMCSLLAWLSAKHEGGRVVLRIEDLDAERCPREFAALLEEDFRWLGLDWDEGGSDGGPAGSYYQSERAEIYIAQFEKLKAQGLVYPCFCSRSEVRAASAPHREDGTPIYNGKCSRLTEEEKAALYRKRRPAMRLRVPDQTIEFTDGHLGRYAEYLPDDCGDFVLRRGDGVFAYQLAVVVDDALMGVSQVVRGADLLQSTPRQLLLYRLLGLPEPEFYHLPLLLAPDGRRLSKRDGDVSLEVLKEKYTAPQVVGRLAFLAGQLDRPEPVTPAELAGQFDWNKVPKTDICLPEGLF